MFSEMWAAEATVLMGGRLVDEVDTNENEVNLSAMAISQNITMMSTVLGTSVMSAIATRTGKFLGAGRARSARRTTTAGILTLVVITVTLNIVLVVFRRGVARAFATEPDLIDLLSNLLFVLAAYSLLQAPALGLMACMMGCGKQKDASLWTVFSFFVVGVGTSWLLGFHFGLGAMGLMLGRVAGKLAHVICLLILVVRTDFEEECDKARERIRKIQMKALAAADAEGSTGGSELSAAVESPAMEEDLVLEVEEDLVVEVEGEALPEVEDEAFMEASPVTLSSTPPKA